jgi:predicted ABC-type transport system involved in lysophospholipase L1 biosynthesis ATPase subunit
VSAPSLLQLDGIVKDYQGLRPLRIQSLRVASGEVVSLGGLDAHAGEVFVHLITGAMLPDEGDVQLFGQNTRSITDGDSWLRSLDRVGIVSGRAVLIEAFSLLQNIAMPFSLDVDPINPSVLPRAVAVAREAGLDAAVWERPVGAVSPDAQMRGHLARALALDPRLLVAEHPTATMTRQTVAGFGADLARIARDRGLALVVITADEEFASAVGGSRLMLHGATGKLQQGSTLGRLRDALRRL